jgi:hypothetical protein
MTTRLPVLKEDAPIGGYEPGFGSNRRTDTWWLGPMVTIIGFSAFIVYVTWAGVQGKYYFADPYLSPLYSPVLFTNLGLAPGAAPVSHALFGTWPAWWPSFLPASPALFILAFPGVFRFTCYYYRKAYYRSFAGSPPGCAVGPVAGKRPYKGETGLLIFQNLHRYALYFALLFVVILSYDAVLSYFKDGKFGVGVGSIILTINPILIAGYTFGCHSLRHLVGGGKDCMSCGKNTVQYKTWKGASWFNGRHMQFAWASLVWVGLTDAYVRLVSMGVINDLNTWG